MYGARLIGYTTSSSYNQRLKCKNDTQFPIALVLLTNNAISSSKANHRVLKAYTRNERHIQPTNQQNPSSIRIRRRRQHPTTRTMQLRIMHILRTYSPIIKRLVIRPNATIQTRRPRSRIAIVRNLTALLLRKQQTALAAIKRQIIQIVIRDSNRFHEIRCFVALVAAGAGEVADVVAGNGFGVVGAPGVGALVADRDGPFAGEAADYAVDFRGVGSVEHAADIVTHILALVGCDVD